MEGLEGERRQVRWLMRADRESVNYCLQFGISECGPGQ